MNDMACYMALKNLYAALLRYLNTALLQIDSNFLEILFFQTGWFHINGHPREKSSKGS